MKTKKLTAKITIISLIVVTIGFCLFIFSCKRDETPAPNEDKVTPSVSIEVLNGSPTLGKEISFVLVEMNPPLLVSDLVGGTSIANAPMHPPDWLKLITPPKPFYQMNFEEYRLLSTDDFLRWRNLETEEKYKTLMAKCIPPADWKGLKSSILYTIEISGEFGKYVWIVEHPSAHLKSATDLTAEDAKWLTFILLKFHNGVYLFESTSVLKSIGLDKFEYKDINQLRSLAKAKKIDASGPMFKIISETD